MGEMIHSSSVPWYYIPVWIIVSTPISISVLFLAGLSSTLKEFIQKKAAFLKNQGNCTDLAIFILFFAPILSVILLNSVLYNGWRHLYFIYPAMVWISILGLKWVQNYLSRKVGNKWINYAIILLISINSIEIINFLIKYHPHQSVYFNVLAGDVEKNFERDYYGVSYKKALTLLLEQEKNDTLKIYSEDFIVKINIMNFKKMEAARIQFVNKIEDSDYISSIQSYEKLDQIRKLSNKNLNKKIHDIKVKKIHDNKGN